jgi:hypothetical protein
MYGHRWFLVLALCAPVAFGQGIYKWVDDKGQVHYGEEAPDGTQAAQVTVKTDAVSAPESDSQSRKENTEKLLRTMEEERTQKQEQEAKEAQEKERRRRNCNIARDDLRNLKDAGSIYTLDKNGERRVYNEAEQAAAIRRAEAKVTEWCK